MYRNAWYRNGKDRNVAIRWSVSYAEAETVLARLHAASGDVQKNAFRGRLKHLKRLGIPLNSNPGRGSKIFYFEDELFQWAFSLELAEFGIDPATIARFIQSEWAEHILPKFHEARGGARRGGDSLFIMYPRLISDAWAPKKFDYEWIEANDRKLLRRLTSYKRRAILINLSDLASEIGQGAIAFHSARAAQSEAED
jgi:hypothetical protein